MDLYAILIISGGFALLFVGDICSRAVICPKLRPQSMGVCAYLKIDYQM